mmetsp:Transcript_10042/g.16442  ORF Transcript_10042/g.16442 Transcript_10042/m.16442 type:complete len:207 (+) Transcript_10042:2761-3381(+)
MGPFLIHPPRGNRHRTGVDKKTRLTIEKVGPGFPNTPRDTRVRIPTFSQSILQKRFQPYRGFPKPTRRKRLRTPLLRVFTPNHNSLQRNSSRHRAQTLALKPPRKPTTNLIGTTLSPTRHPLGTRLPSTFFVNLLRVQTRRTGNPTRSSTCVQVKLYPGPQLQTRREDRARPTTPHQRNLGIQISTKRTPRKHLSMGIFNTFPIPL